MIRQDITGIVLAGGQSRRMGQDKALMEFHGKPLIQHAVTILQHVCSRVIISSNKQDYLFTGCEIWPDELAVKAPLSGIYTCLKRSTDDWIAVLSCDMPAIHPGLFRHLLSCTQNFDVVVPVHDLDRIEPLCCLYNRSAIPLLEQFVERQQYSLQQFIRASRHNLVEIGVALGFYSNGMFANLNTAEDMN
jgi:molybdenum cofactor guanylyltransferase